MSTANINAWKPIKTNINVANILYKDLYNYLFLYTNRVLILKVYNVLVLTNIARLISCGSYIKCYLNKYCNGLQWIQNSVLLIILNNTDTRNYNTAIFRCYYGRNNSLISTFSASEYFSENKKFHGFQHINTSRITLHHFLKLIDVE